MFIYLYVWVLTHYSLIIIKDLCSPFVQNSIFREYLSCIQKKSAADYILINTTDSSYFFISIKKAKINLAFICFNTQLLRD